MTDQRPRYLAYMLRLWEARTGGEQVWRASLESPHTGERQAFADSEALFAFLGEKMSGPPAGEEQPEDISAEEKKP